MRYTKPNKFYGQMLPSLERGILYPFFRILLLLNLVKAQIPTDDSIQDSHYPIYLVLCSDNRGLRFSGR